MIFRTLKTRFFFSNKNIDEVLHNYSKELQKIKSAVKQGKMSEQAYDQTVTKFNKEMMKVKKEEKLNKIKNYFLRHIEEEKPTPAQTSDLGFIPNFLVMKKLMLDDRKILMIGVEEENEDHSIYIKKLAEKMGVKLILTALSPDLPYFIKSQSSYHEEWTKFLKDPFYAKEEATFYISPSPKIIEDLCLQKQRISVVKNGLAKSKQFNEILYAMLQYDAVSQIYKPNTLLAPLVTFGIESIYFCDYPVFKEREMWANTIPLPELKQIFQVYKQNKKEGRLKNFDSRILFPRKILNKKFQYMANIIKLASYQTDGVSFFICPAEYCEIFAQEWKKKKQIKHYLQYYEGQPIENLAFVDFIEKLVILDIICEPFIQKYFIKHKSFPFSASHTIGGKEHIGKIMIIWEHFYKKYKEELFGPQKRSDFI